jgi:superfamily II DNA or RNA helicase
MSKYPDTTNDNFYSKITDIFNEYKVPKKIKSLEEICMPKSFNLQLPQKFLENFMSPKTPYKGILVYHRIGAGKTCTAVRIGEKWKKHKRIVVVVPASLKGNFRNELRSLCAEDNYLKDSERKQLSTLHPNDKKYKDIIKLSDDRIDKYYEIYSYNKFVDLINAKKLNLKNTLLIVDEVQNMVSEEGSFYSSLYDAIHNAPKDLRIVLLSATPMFDKPNEIALTMNLLRIPDEFPTGRNFDKLFIKTKKKEDGTYAHKVVNIDLFKEMTKGYISFFRGAPPHVFPKMTIKYVNCEMKRFQYEAYLRVLKNEEVQDSKKILKATMRDLNVTDLPNNFYIGTRMISNVVFPNKKLGAAGLKSLTYDRIITELHKYSIKFYEIMTRIENCSGKIFVYSAFKEFGGIKSFIKVLEAYGYSDYIKSGDGTKRFAVLSGDENIATKERIKAVFNMKNNLMGKRLKIVIGSPATKEGISFSAVRQVHILEPYWNKSRLDQIIGRASRFCSHKDLPEEKRNVKVYVYIATHKKILRSIDEHMYTLITQKSKIINSFEKAIKESAIDCNLNKNANVDVNRREDIICDK